jgi:ribokinase
MVSRGSKIMVIGSLNIDLVIRTPRMPLPGENVFGKSFRMFPGGKGANQAVGAARLGAKVTMFGRVGKDIFGERLLKNLREEKVNANYVEKDESEATGMAFICVDDTGENSIIVVSGANMRCSKSDIDRVTPLFPKMDLLILQLEIPPEVVGYAIEIAHGYHLPVILNPAPTKEFEIELLGANDILTPNRYEAALLSGVKIKDLESAKLAAQRLQDRGVEKLVITMGEKGALWVDGKEIAYVPARSIKPEDTTAAGDAFTAGLSVALTEDKELEEAVRFANDVAALSITKSGAQTSLPTRREVKEFNWD